MRLSLPTVAALLAIAATCVGAVWNGRSYVDERVKDVVTRAELRDVVQQQGEIGRSVSEMAGDVKAMRVSVSNVERRVEEVARQRRDGR